MSKQIEKLKKQLIDISEVVNSFRSEAVQVKVVEKLLDAMIESERTDADGVELFNKKTYRHRTDNEAHAGRITKKPGATKVLNQLLSTDFFKTPHSISSIAG